MAEKRYIDKLDDDLWTTKGARFTAHSRLITKAQISNVTNGILSFYLIVFGLMSVYNLIDEKTIDPNLVAFGITAISILVLLFGQIEVANDYKVRGISFHNCALEISKLLREVKAFKETVDVRQQEDHPSDVEFCNAINEKYNLILEKYDNHKTLDYNKFKLQNSDYFKLRCGQKFRYWMVYYLDIYWLYAILICSPIVVMVCFFIR